MRFVDIIEKKKNGGSLTREEIHDWISGYVDGRIPDYQTSALLMAIIFRGMNEEETFYLTDEMLRSGDRIDLSGIEGLKADKHSTGGVGDKTSLVLAPLAAACGVKMAKMSGRGLGFTGGTIDKLESISGFSAELPREDFIRQVNEIGLAIAGQTGNLVPADKKLYALRDVTGTVDSIPLIASSIMSKKLAAGSDVIVLDVKYGSGAFMKTPEEAGKLAETMIRIGTMAGKKVRAVISSMVSPLGNAVGNSLEVIEAVQTLKGQGPEVLLQLCMEIGSLILQETGKAGSETEAKEMLSAALADGSALEKLRQMVIRQGGDVRLIDDTDLFEKAPLLTQVCASEDGYLESIDALAIGNLAMRAGAGRARKEDQIDPAAGILLKKKPGDRICAGDVLAEAYHRQSLSAEWMRECKAAFVIRKEETKPVSLIHSIL